MGQEDIKVSFMSSSVCVCVCVLRASMQTDGGEPLKRGFCCGSTPTTWHTILVEHTWRSIPSINRKKEQQAAGELDSMVKMMKGIQYVLQAQVLSASVHLWFCHWSTPVPYHLLKKKKILIKRLNLPICCSNCDLFKAPNIDSRGEESEWI